MNWQIGVTTVPARTLDYQSQIHKAGWDEIKVFSDLDFWGTWRSWLMAWLHLYVIYPETDYYLLFEDDIVCAANLRQHLEVILPNLGEFLAMSLYNPDGPHNQHFQRNYLIENVAELDGNFWGTQAILFPRESLQRFLTDPEILNYSGRRHRDTQLGKYAYRNQEILYCHKPSLVQHVGRESLIGNNFHEARDFVGEAYDCRNLKVVFGRQWLL